MSSTKIVIIVLVLVGVLFVVFMTVGAFKHDPPPPQRQELKSSAKKQPERPWAKTIKGLFSSLQPKIKLKQTIYSGPADEPIPPDDKHPFRTVTFHWLSGTAEIAYDDKTPQDSKSPLKDMDDPQRCTLKQTDSDVKDKERCSILALKGGGTFTFKCLDNAACRVEVE